MKLLLLGASGGCGRIAVRLAAEQGHDVTAMVRPGASFDPPAGVTVIRSNALDPEQLAQAAAGKDALISCLGAQRVHPRNPWSKMRQPAQVAGPSGRAIVKAVPTTSVRRVAVISAAGVGDSLPATNWIMRWILRTSNVGVAYADLHVMEQALRQSSLDWIAVRPVTLINAAPSSRAKIVKRFGALSVIGRADVAQWLIRVATSNEPISNRTPMIGWR